MATVGVCFLFAGCFAFVQQKFYCNGYSVVTVQKLNGLDGQEGIVRRQVAHSKLKAHGLNTDSERELFADHSFTQSPELECGHLHDPRKDETLRNAWFVSVTYGVPARWCQLVHANLIVNQIGTRLICGVCQRR